MHSVPFKPPEFDATSFNCPSCFAYAKQNWYDALYASIVGRYVPGLRVAQCTHCTNWSYWRNGEMVSPTVVTAEPPNNDLEEEIQQDYWEAAEIAARSPRGAAALLRLALQKMCDGQLGAKGNKIDDQIADLVAKGLSVKVQQSLDSLRVIGNEAVHPGTIDLRDDTATADALFRLVNFIADQLITQPKQIEEIYGKLPESKKKAIEDRDRAGN